MLHRVIIVLLSGWVGWMSVADRCLAEEDLGTQVQQLVQQLDDDDLVQRKAAEQQLVALGPDVLPLLPDADRRTPPEMKTRLQRIRSRLEEVAAAKTAEASRVTFEGTMLLSEALTQLKSQTGNQLVDLRTQFGEQQTDPAVTVKFINTPFWEALDSIMGQAAMAVYNYGGRQRTLALKAREEGVDEDARRIAYDGVFRIEATQIESNRDLRQPDQQGMRVRLEITWEPRVVPISITLPLDATRAVDDRDQPLVVDDRQTELEAAVHSTVSFVEMDLRFQLPSRQAKSISSLSAEAFALVPGRVETFTFDDLETADNIRQKRAGVEIVLQKIRQNVDVREVRILVRFEETSGALASHRDWIYTNQAYLMGPNGNRIDNAGFETTRQARNEIGLSYKFAVDGGLADHQFVYETPAAILRRPFQFELQEIPLP